METKVPENIFKGYKFLSSEHSSGERKGGRDILQDLPFEECIVTELNLGRKKKILYSLM